MHQDSDKDQEAAKIAELRALMFGEQGEHLHHAIRPQAKELVEDVISEALKERQQKDESVFHVVTPLVEATVEESVTQHSERFTTLLYPLVGSMVRKAARAFLAQFVEKTNTLIENAVSVKGMKMRYQAWKLSIPFSQYLVAQSYRYHVDIVLLIHRETGMLLNSVASDNKATDNADLISSMLTAINDFVVDSFAEHTNVQQLDEVKTDDLTLYISHGPNAILVAASQGVIPIAERTKFANALEQIHGLFAQELADYKGDTEPFQATESLLHNCLITEKKQNTQPKKKPWAGYFVVGIIIVLIAMLIWLRVETSYIANKLTKLNESPGILLTDVQTRGLNSLEVYVLRDPLAQSINSLLSALGIEKDNLTINEKTYSSLSPAIIKKRIDQVISLYPNVIFESEGELQLVGKLSWNEMQRFDKQFYSIPGIEELSVDRSQLVLEKLSLQSEQPGIKKQLFEQLVGEVSRIQIQFAVNEIRLDETARQNIQSLSTLLRDLFELSDQLDLRTSLIIIGASDTTGNAAKNQRLSLDRANVVKAALINQGMTVSKLFATGIGEVALSSDAMATRRVMFNIMYSNSNSNKPSAYSQ